MPSERRSRLVVAGKWLLAATVPISAHAIGSLHTRWLMGVTMMAAASCALVWSVPPARTSAASRWLLRAALLLLAVTALQLIPLPAAVVSVVAPGSADAWSRVLTPFHLAGPQWHSISVAPAATHVEVLRGTFYACVFLAGLRVAYQEGGSRFLEGVVIISSTALALTTLAHAAMHADRVFGIYRPRELGYLPGRLGPLLNPNHVAAYCNVGAVVAVGVALRERAVAPRVLGAAGAILLSATSVWAGSRGGTGSLVFGLALVAGLAFALRRRRIDLSGRRITVPVALGGFLAAALLLALSASDEARSDLAAQDLSKLAIIKSSFRLVALSPVLGTGRGSFETLYPLVNTSESYLTFLRPENVVAQWSIEWGVPVAIAAFAMLTLGLGPRTVLRSRRPAIGPWVALQVAVLHDLVDFHLEVPGVVVLLAICAAAVVGKTTLTEARSAFEPSRPSRFLPFGLPVAACFALLFCLPGLGHTLAEDREAIAGMALDPSVSSDAFRRNVEAAMLRYPAEPFFPLAGAIHAQVKAGESSSEAAVVPWVARALERYPRFGRAHLVLARTLARRHRSQARLEYRLAYLYDIVLHATVVREVVSLIDDEDSALEVIGGPGQVEMLDGLVVALSDRLPSTAARLDEELQRRDPTARGPLRRSVRAAMSDVENAHPWCSNADRGFCLANALASANELISGEPTKCEPYVLRARLRVAAGDGAAALEELSRSIDKTMERSECFRSLVELALTVGDKRRVDHTLELATRSGCGSRDDCLALYTWAAQTEDSRGNAVRAIAFYKRAAELAPANDDALRRIAELAERMGLTAEAIDANEKLAMRHPDDPTWRARADQMRSKAAERRINVPNEPLPH